MYKSKEAAERAYKAYLAKKHDTEDEEDLGEKNTRFNLMFVDGEDSKITKQSLCVKRKKEILRSHHPNWSEERLLVTAIAQSKQADGVIPMIKKVGGAPTTGTYYGIGRVPNISLKKISGLIQQIKTKKSKKVGHAGMAPFLVELPMKNLNRLQTKLEKVFTAEQKFLTAEQKSQRAQYAVTMKKADADEIAEIIGEENMSYFAPDPAFMFDTIELSNVNTELNNIVKAPIILARELIQPYVMTDKSGSKRIEHHFKPYAELAKSVEGVESLPIIIEHKDSYEDEEIIGYVKELRADEELRAIRGMGYFYQSRLPEVLLDAFNNGEPVGVSIGFMAELGGSGLWNGKLYDYTQENIMLEHLAICLDSIPRCPIDLCGVNVDKKEEKDEVDKFTIIKKDSHYYNIKDILVDIEETRTESKISEQKPKSDSMPDDSFADPKSGNISSGTEPKDFETMLGRLRRYMAGESDLIKPQFAKNMIMEIMHMTDEGEEKEISDTQKGEDMEDKEFEDALAKKDEEIAALKDIVKDSLIKEIKSFTDSETLEKLALEDKCIASLREIRDTVALFKPEKKEAEVLPIESKKEKEEAMEDADAAPSKKVKKWDTAEMFADVNKEFEDLGITISG